MKYNIIIIVGATATGKSDLAIKIAKMLNTEIINADSTQVYKYLNVGTAKITKNEMQGIRHHLISIINPNDKFSVSQYKEKAMKIIKKLHSNNKIPIVVGGTGFYIDSLINDYNYAKVANSEYIRNKYQKFANEKGNLELYKLLQIYDPQAAKTIHYNDVKRVIRALEIYDLTGKPKTSNTMQSTVHNSINNTMQNLKPLMIGLNMPRSELYNKINMRTDAMLSQGLLKEAKQLYDLGYSHDLQSFKSIGYKEIFSYFRGEINLEQACDLIKKNTRNYAKRQNTWFKRYNNIVWFDVLQTSLSDIASNVISLLD